MLVVSKIEKKLQFPYVVKHSMSIEQQLIPIYNTTVHKNKTNNGSLNVANCLCHKFNDTNRPVGQGLYKEEDPF